MEDHLLVFTVCVPRSFDLVSGSGFSPDERIRKRSKQEVLIVVHVAINDVTEIVCYDVIKEIRIEIINRSGCA